MTARFLHRDGVDLCLETFGSPDDPTVLLIHGAAASMLWWDEALCRRIAALGRFVIRYDNRDTGLSPRSPAGEPDYDLRDLAEDALRILDGLDRPYAHVVAASMCGAVGVHLAVDHPERVASLTLVTTTSGAEGLSPIGRDLEPTGPEPDPADLGQVHDHVVAGVRAYSGPSRYYDAASTNALVAADIARTADVSAALTNHYLIDFPTPERGGLADIAAPTLVVHGERDPVFPLDHGEDLAATVPGARLLVLPGAGHELPEPLWPLFLDEFEALTTAAGAPEAVS